MRQNMKICFCGLGSIGKKHLINLASLLSELDVDFEIHALRQTNAPLDMNISTLLAKQYFSSNELDRHYDIVFITNPTNMHYSTIKLFEARADNMFIEKPLFDNPQYDTNNLEAKKTGVYYVAGPLRFSSVIQTLEDILKTERVISIRAISSSYLPDWRKDTDYRLCYSAKKGEGGGVCLDLIHEWDYIIHLFGFPLYVNRISGKYSALETDSDDLGVYTAAYEDKTVELHLDYFGRPSKRQLELFTQNGTIIGDFLSSTISISGAFKSFNKNPQGTEPASTDTIQFKQCMNDIYIKEMRFFINNILARTDFNNLRHCHKILKLALGEDFQ